MTDFKRNAKNPSGAPDFTSGFYRGSCCPVNCVSLFHIIGFSFFVFFIVSFDCSSWLITWPLNSILIPLNEIKRNKIMF